MKHNEKETISTEGKIDRNRRYKQKRIRRLSRKEFLVNHKRWIPWIAGGIIIIIGILVLSVKWWMGEVEKKNQESLRQEVVNEPPKDNKENVCPIDFETLQYINEDAYAWLLIPDTEISYPILRHPEDNNYYLEHTLERSAGLPGSIYTENYNTMDFTDVNTIVYGHNMRNGTMFAGLHQYEDSEFLEEHPEIEIYTPQKKLTYRIIAINNTDDVHLMYQYNCFATEEDVEKFIRRIQGVNEAGEFYDTNYTYEPGDCLLTLSTCISNRSDKRFLVVGVLETIQEFSE